MIELSLIPECVPILNRKLESVAAEDDHGPNNS